MRCDICIDVDDVRRAVVFYGEGVGLSVVQEEADWAHLKVGDQTIWIMKAPSGKAGTILSDYAGTGRLYIWTSTWMTSRAPSGGP
jgi:catechol-2,3-dioxygenase